MAISHSTDSEGTRPALTRRDVRRRETIEEALDHAVAVMTESGVGALTVSEVARRMGIRSPSLYKYFPSLHALYDAVFARALLSSIESVDRTVVGAAPGVERLAVAGEAVVRWAVSHPALAQLLYWRPIPGFEPSPETFAPSQADARRLREELRQAVRLGQLDVAADSDEAVRLYTILLSGVMTQQMANQPAASYEDGHFTRLTGTVIDMFLGRYQRRT